MLEVSMRFIPFTSLPESAIVCINLCLLAIIFSVDMIVPLGVAGGVPYLVVVLLSLWSERRGLVVGMAVAGSLLTIAGFFSSPAGGELWKVLSNRALALFAIWATTVLGLQWKAVQEDRETALRERESALNDLRILRGMLPICANCKKIRDKEGDWYQLESYIRNHSEAEFSHGICEDCQQMLYSDYLK